MKKSVIAILTATIILLSTMVPLLYIKTANAIADPLSWYMTVPGVLNSDTYSLYPFDKTSLTIGFSKFGELINPEVGLPGDGVGLMYGNNSAHTANVDPFSADPFVPMFEWNQGWLINITYTYSSEYRNVWAFALFSDSYSDPGSIGGDWRQASSPDNTTVLGGRKYGGIRYAGGAMIPIGYAATAPLTVLYNGPRSFIALCQNTIGEDASTPLVGVYITIVFDKVKKYVMLYKDVKLLDQRKFAGDLQVEFSNRGEWDLGLTLRPASWAHWFEGFDTSYDTGYQPFYAMPEYTGEAANAPLAQYDVAQVISTSNPGFVGWAAYWPTPISIWMDATYLTSRTTILSSLETTIKDFTGNGVTKIFQLPNTQNVTYPVAYPRGQGIWKDDPLVFVNGILKPEDPLDPQGWQWINGNVVFNQAPGVGAIIWIEYKTYVHKVDMTDSPRTPYIIGEWDFVLSWTNITASTNMFRAVTVYGVTDYHDANDGNTGEGRELPIQLDREVTYQLDEVFSPFDLYSAVEKKTDRWVEYNTVLSTTFTTHHVPTLVVDTTQWDQYNVFSERVEDLTNGTVYNRWLGQYSFISNDDGTATFYGLDPTHWYKFLYSTYTSYSKVAPLNITTFGYGTVENGTSSQTHSLNDYIYTAWPDPTGVWHTLGSDTLYFSFTNKSTTSMTTSEWFNYTSPDHGEWDVAPFKVFKEDTTTLETMSLPSAALNVSGGIGTRRLEFTVSATEFEWTITGPQGPLFTDLQDVHFQDFSADPVIHIDVFYNATTLNYTVYPSVSFGQPGLEETYNTNVYQYTIPGRYEWVTVGRDASTVDSAGAVDIAAAFKDKQVEIGNTAMDMMGVTYQGQIPYLLSKTTSGKTPDFQNYWITPDTTSPGQRLSLADDWCTRYPVSSSNIIAEGGPLANQITEYFNSFTTAFYGEPWFTPYAPWQGAIVALSCWSATNTTANPKHYYVNSGGQNGTGYATIGTYLDLNGTVGFVIYGLDARDTYYASKFFYEDIIQELQNFPDGVTSIVLKIDYTDAKHPTFTIPEALGTISETLVVGSTNAYLTSQLKGGIHPDP